ncbi:MAG: hypothetical protein FJX72_17335, partial [Armatimonadetes bacterium]|nr:hypothetical protein [Armatimonadota bacterium]
MVRERVYGIACGNEDANDLDPKRDDAPLKGACGHRPSRDEALATQPTVSRMENPESHKDAPRMAIAQAERVVAQLPANTRSVVLDVDATDDPGHGQQQVVSLGGCYDERCYVPLLLYVTGHTGRQRLMCSLLRPGNASYRLGLFRMPRRAVRILRARFAEFQIIRRADSGFGEGDVLTFCERHNRRLQEKARVRRRTSVVRPHTDDEIRAAALGAAEEIEARLSAGEPFRRWEETLPDRTTWTYNDETVRHEVV